MNKESPASVIATALDRALECERLHSEADCYASAAAVTRQRRRANPFNRADVLYPGSVQHLPEYQASQNMTDYVASVARVPQPDADSESSDHGLLARVSNASRIIFEMFNFSQESQDSTLKSPTFVIVCLSGVLVYIDELSYYFYLVIRHF